MSAAPLLVCTERGKTMQWSGWINFGYTVALFVAFIVAVVYYYNPKRKSVVEEPKFRMMAEDDEGKYEKGQKNDITEK